MSRKHTPDQDPTQTPTSESPAAVADPPPTQADGRSFAERVGQRKTPTIPDPFNIATDLLAGVRLFESKRDRQMAITFDEKPGEPVLNKLKDAGFHWNARDRIWAHPIGSASAASTRIEAERLYQEVRHMLREAKGIDTQPDIPF